MRKRPIQLSVPEQHRLRIARKTLNMTAEMAMILGGMTLAEAKEIVEKYKHVKGVN